MIKVENYENEGVGIYWKDLDEDLSLRGFLVNELIAAWVNYAVNHKDLLSSLDDLHHYPIQFLPKESAYYS